MPNFGYHLARLKGDTRRCLFRMLLPLTVRRRIDAPCSFPAEVFSYSSEANLPEQIASIRSFLRCVGRPKRFTVVSDGTHQKRSIQLLENIDPTVKVQSVQPSLVEFPAGFREYLAQHPTGKQLGLIMSLPIEGPVLYIDSDVLFFEAARDLVDCMGQQIAPASYLADCQFSGDERLLHEPAEKTEPVNTGVLLLFSKLDWSLAVDRFQELKGAPGFFTNQTLTHLVMHANGARPLDPNKYVLRLDDQFIYGDRYAGPDLVLRHYVQPVRHKFWTTLKF